jgi:excisionase family DNA binding protein
MNSLLTVSEVSNWLRISKKTLYNMVSLGRIPYVKAGGALRFSAEQIQSWLLRAEAMKTTGEQKP